ncbi:hypothetical protein HYX70_02805 [Candidatus Saccharibacteria bacterium]|nr:hypothetical protein [Candidatus Saccharibacteria bacterium]
MILADPKRLIPSDSFGVKGKNYYWNNPQRFGISEHELKDLGITDETVLVDLDLKAPLALAKQRLGKYGYTIAIVDGYRSPELYKIAHRTRSKVMGKANANALMNLKDMPHASGRVVDVQLIDTKTGKEVYMRDSKDSIPAHFVGFYTDKNDAQSKTFQRLQDLLVKTMLSLGFKLGSKKEYWHFELPLDK